MHSWPWHKSWGSGFRVVHVFLASAQDPDAWGLGCGIWGSHAGFRVHSEQEAFCAVSAYTDTFTFTYACIFA